MKIASAILDRVEEYRYLSGAIGDVRTLPLPILAVRLNAFYKVHSKAVKAAKGGPTSSSKNRRR